ncbi:MAG: endopeptidase IV [Sulfurimonas sp. RIFCSPHIGHO2_12_FULL_36_9]|uniref:signal peptide peptidase SppA n=1 Tax=Sulfurimonas sp. RIFCSPLOWO2_12_36_12 TaxID=1802253 RepID=UPI0008C5F3E4|nr:signal peptide peptidase SppA [Sulfurimonas sp. RIFCSPLOWO2_12_36_12]OHD96849.1 MAG: endopeptidase IV [Sulfurimonas sp. RIFCSPHIGHO2_12_FULL_36_9]OHE00091.1 MAG: endopeptidase IV [Sulfurimonas sp. RIFCSPLOWO2_12_36_12]OHE07932.1 MAG: endopeptidase IV [Sulfurimonas sp. RIFCSPLOWO2_12_FULL_36_74]
MQFIKNIFSPILAVMKFIQEHFKAMIFLLIVFLIFAPTSNEDLKPNNLEEIYLTGPIMDVSDVVKQIDEASSNEHVRGILLNVDSPGGAVAPSIEVAYAIKRAREKKPVIAYASGTIASGSYYASIWANEIVANPGSMVGSIGVIMQGADVSELMSKIGIKSQSVQAGKYKKVGAPDREWTKYEIDELNKVINGTYDLFTTDVANARGLDINKRDDYANAHIFTAHQAKDVGLVDSIGVGYDAKNRLAQLSGVVKPVWNEDDKIDRLMKKLSAQTAVMLYTYFPDLVMK